MLKRYAKQLNNEDEVLRKGTDETLRILATYEEGKYIMLEVVDIYNNYEVLNHKQVY